ncbi:MAG: PAS domain S-box protein, partial [Deltaproteobacteria bacterium]|nr:PAS domain S-box protein [Deltaproteobacteria bacterium]
MAIGLYITSLGVQTDIDHIVEDRLQETIKNSHNSRDFGLLYSRLNVFRTTFYGHPSFFEKEGATLKKNINELQLSVQGTHLQELLAQLNQQLETYLIRGKWINTIISWRSEQDEDIDDLLLVLQELLAERTIEMALQGGSVDYFEQLVMLISGYRESLLEIAKLNAEEDRSIVLAGKVTDPPPLETELSNLALRLRTLTASEPPIDRFGRHLISRIDYYQYLMLLYQLEMIQLNQQNQKLDQLTQQILSSMEQLDQQTSSAALQTRREIKKTIYTTVASVLGLLFLMAVISWISHRTLFKKHIQTPMDLVSQRLADFQNGDHTTPMELMRQDEWGGIEEVFNKMLFTLQEHVAALRDSEKRYREIFTNATEGIYRATLEGQFLDVNPAAAAMFGWDSEEEAKAYYTDFKQQLYADPHTRERLLKELHTHGKCLGFESLLRRKNGDLFWALLNNYLVYDESGNVLYIEGTVQDISSRKEAQESLQQLQSYLQNIVDSMPSILIGVDKEMKVTLWNKRAEQETELTAGKTKGLPMMQAWQLFDSSIYLAKLKETLQAGKPLRIRKIESFTKTEGGNRRFFDMLIYPLALAEGSGAVIHMDDISEQVRLEEMMVRSEKMQSVGGLAAGLAHEINNPLAIILQNVQVLSRRLSPDLKQNHEVAQELGTTIETITQYIQLRGCEKMLQSISNAGQRAAKTVNNMQSF